MNKVLESIFEYCKRRDWQAYQDALAYLNVHYDKSDMEGFRNLVIKQMAEKPTADLAYAHKMSLLISAQRDFDSYMQYMEYDRKPAERFWLPRRQVLMPVCEALQALADDELDELFLSMPPRVGKALANDTPILTRKGWKNHGDLTVGDEVIGMDGKFKKVIAVHPKCMLDVLVEFSNGATIQCHENHEWLFYDRAQSKNRLEETKVWEKRSLCNSTVGRGHRYTLQLPYHEKINGEEKDLPVKPYTLGVWLGDGVNKNPTITGDKNDYPVIEGIIKDGYTLRWQTCHKITGVMYYGFDFRFALQDIGMCHSRRTTPKHIPDIYLTASYSQRMDLLAGLLDTDGCLRRSEHRYDFTTADVELKNTFLQLIATFGWRTSVKEVAPHTSSSGIVGKRAYWVISFNPDDYIPCRLERKQLREFSKPRMVAVTGIKRVAPKEGNCITVEDGMYLAGYEMIPTHNTTLTIFFTTWVMGKETEYPKLYSSYSDIITKAFYNGVMELLTDFDTYKYKEIFPKAVIARTNAQDETIDLERKKHYPTLTCRSLYGTLNGACDAEKGIIISDDLIGGIEEALNKDRLKSAWDKVDNNLIPRGKGGTKYLWIGTRWSIADPAGIRMELLENDEKFKGHRWKVINTPALSDRDESNFKYDYGVGFTTVYYQRRRASFERNNDIASWNAQYMGEPIEREGTVFSPNDFRYFNGTLPEGEPDRIFMAVDPAWGGGDFVASPICYQYGSDIFVADVVYSNEDKGVTQPLIANKVMKHNVSFAYIEGTKMTASYGEGVDELLKKQGKRINIQTSTKHFTGMGKEQRIFDKAPDIREHFIFLQSGNRRKEYELFMQSVFSFKIQGKNKNDDACDSLAMATTVAFYPTSNRATVTKRLF